jgi:hypothetical protein
VDPEIVLVLGAAGLAEGCGDQDADAAGAPAATVHATRAATAAVVRPRRRMKFIGDTGHLHAVQLSSAGGRAVSRPCEISSFASPPRDGFALSGVTH